MSGTLPQYRPVSVPTGKIKGFKFVTRPGGVYKNGRCVEFFHDIVPVYEHTLVPYAEPNRPSKHARGRMRPRTKAERKRFRAMNARIVQSQKSWTVDINRMAALNLLDQV